MRTEKKESRGVNIGKLFEEKRHGKTKVDTKKNHWLALILKANKSFRFKWVSFRDTEFRCDNNTYFAVPDGMFLNPDRLLIGIYLEGISTPLSHRNVKRKTVDRTVPLDNGKTETIKVDVVQGLKYDSEIIDILLNRGLAEKLTEIKPEKTIFVLIVMVIINIVITIVAVGVEFA